MRGDDGSTSPVESDHFIVHAPASDQEAATEMLTALEAAWAKVCDPADAQAFLVVPYTVPFWSDSGAVRKMNVAEAAWSGAEGAGVRFFRDYSSRKF